MRVWPKQLMCSMSISSGKTALVLGSPSADLRDDQRAFMKVRLRWFLLQRACVIFGQHDQRRVAVLCVVLLYTAQLRPQLGCTRVRATETCRRWCNSLHVISCVGSVSAFSKKMLGHLATWPPAKWSQAGRRSAGQGAKFEAAGWEDAAVWRSNTVEKSASWFD